MNMAKDKTSVAEIKTTNLFIEAILLELFKRDVAAPQFSLLPSVHSF